MRVEIINRKVQLEIDLTHPWMYYPNLMVLANKGVNAWWHAFFNYTYMFGTPPWLGPVAYIAEAYKRKRCVYIINLNNRPLPENLNELINAVEQYLLKGIEEARKWKYGDGQTAAKLLCTMAKECIYRRVRLNKYSIASTAFFTYYDLKQRALSKMSHPVTVKFTSRLAKYRIRDYIHTPIGSMLVSVPATVDQRSAVLWASPGLTDYIDDLLSEQIERVFVI